jgi:hypothetical protein
MAKMTQMEIDQINCRILKQELQRAVSGGLLTVRMACNVLLRSREWPSCTQVIQATPSDKIQERFGKN